jgi:hypothetical protein
MYTAFHIIKTELTPSETVVNLLAGVELDVQPDKYEETVLDHDWDENPLII